MRYQLAVLLCCLFTQVQLRTDTIRRNSGTDSAVDGIRKYVRKCCPVGQGIVNSTCQNMSEPFDFNGWSGNGGFNASADVDVMFRVNCSITNGSSPLFAYPALRDYYLTSNGTLLIFMGTSSPVMFDRDNYCIDRYLTKQNTIVMNTVFCYLPEPYQIKYTLNAYCMLISCFFILLTVVVYACLPKMLNLPNMVLVTYLLSFFVSFLCLATITFLEGKEPTRVLCNTLTFIIYFSMLSAFTWINVMCYDTWNKFGGESKYQLTSPRSNYYRYCFYGFGVPTALTVFLAICEFTDIPVPIKPELDVQKCFFDGKVKQLYLYLPISILCFANIILFILTALKITGDQKQTEKVYSQGGRIHNKRDEKRFMLYIKLFTIMGISWVLEVVSTFYPAASVLWQVSDAYNLLVGFVIFMMFVCKRKIYDKITNRFKLTRKLTRSTAQTTLTISQQIHSAQLPDTMERTKNGPIELPILKCVRKLNGAENYI